MSAPAELAVKVGFLLRRAFPQPPEAIETHMSWVFLTADRAYKLKKPVTTPLFDHRSVEARRADCEAEIELNQALAPGVYLRAAPLTRDRDGALAIDGRGEVIDWLVIMRRLPADSMLDKRLTEGAGSMSAAEIEQLAEHLARFYAAAEPAPMNPAAFRAGLLRVLEEDRAELLRHDHALDHSEIAEVTARLRLAVETHSLLDERCARVVDGHGDLRPEHILVGPSPLVIDRITFDVRLRLVDPVHDLALLSIECECLGAPGLGDEVSGAYLARARDPASSTTIALYRSLRATTRARLSIAHLVDSDRDAAKWLDRTDAYLAVARRHLDDFEVRARGGSGVEVEQIAE